MQIIYQKPLWSSYIQPSVHALWIPTKTHGFIHIFSAQIYCIIHLFLGPACSGCNWTAMTYTHAFCVCEVSPRNLAHIRFIAVPHFSMDVKGAVFWVYLNLSEMPFSLLSERVLQWQSQGLLLSLSYWGLCGGMVRIKVITKRFTDSFSNASFWEILKLFLTPQQPATIWSKS